MRLKPGNAVMNLKWEETVDNEIEHVVSLLIIDQT